MMEIPEGWEKMPEPYGLREGVWVWGIQKEFMDESVFQMRIYILAKVDPQIKGKKYAVYYNVIDTRRFDEHVYKPRLVTDDLEEAKAMTLKLKTDPPREFD